jgi:hypothetical protein
MGRTALHCHPDRLAAATGGCSNVSAPSAAAPAPSTAKDPMLQKTQTMTARFAPVDLSADISALPAANARPGKTGRGGAVFDALYLRQVWEGNEALLVGSARISPSWVARGWRTSC